MRRLQLVEEVEKLEKLGFQESADESASVAKGTPRELRAIRDHKGRGERCHKARSRMPRARAGAAG